MTPDVETPPLYQAILDAVNEAGKAGASTGAIGAVAWERLSGQQRRDALPSLLTAYVSTVLDEEHARQLEKASADPTHTYLTEFDVAMLWDSVHTPVNKFGEVPVEHDALLNVLCELELVQHRLAMHAEGGEG